MPAMRLLYVTDLHGSRWKYDRLLATAVACEAGAVINGGDLLPKSGNPFSEQPRFIKEALAAHFAAFDAAGIHYLACSGNDDLMCFDDLFEATCARYPFVHSLTGRKIVIGGYEFIGMNWIVDYPFRLKDRCRMDTAAYVFGMQYGTGLLSQPNGWRELSDWFTYARSQPTLATELERLPRPADMTRSVYVIHMPPHHLGLDECGSGPRVGSVAVYDFLRASQPRLALHGHIHESPEVSGRWSTWLDRTLCIQPGQLDPFTYVVIDLATLACEVHREDR
jgi:Icc-related predicted phosphoesterase